MKYGLRTLSVKTEASKVLFPDTSIFESNFHIKTTQLNRTTKGIFITPNKSYMKPITHTQNLTPVNPRTTKLVNSICLNKILLKKKQSLINAIEKKKVNAKSVRLRIAKKSKERTKRNINGAKDIIINPDRKILTYKIHPIPNKNIDLIKRRLDASFW